MDIKVDYLNFVRDANLRTKFLKNFVPTIKLLIVARQVRKDLREIVYKEISKLGYNLHPVSKVLDALAPLSIDYKLSSVHDQGFQEFISNCACALYFGDLLDTLTDEDWEMVNMQSDDKKESISKIARGLEEKVNRYLPQSDINAEHFQYAVELVRAEQQMDKKYTRVFQSGFQDEIANMVFEYRTRKITPRFARFAFEKNIFDKFGHLPYFCSQYERVAVPLAVAAQAFTTLFRKELDQEMVAWMVGTTIGVQIAQDDFEDFEADILRKKLTPITAELFIAKGKKSEAIYQGLEIGGNYLDLTSSIKLPKHFEIITAYLNASVKQKMKNTLG